ncbi:hypothetical protein BV20DRAFT_264070 [Pilatotrama ljubarskyi]|nr:hypothetical protein BV20DRAFT_264070 [Pilatotrama ljubarskyi]
MSHEIVLLLLLCRSLSLSAPLSGVGPAIHAEQDRTIPRLVCKCSSMQFAQRRNAGREDSCATSTPAPPPHDQRPEEVVDAFALDASMPLAMLHSTVASKNANKYWPRRLRWVGSARDTRRTDARVLHPALASASTTSQPRSEPPSCDIRMPNCVWYK